MVALICMLRIALGQYFVISYEHDWGSVHFGYIRRLRSLFRGDSGSSPLSPRLVYFTFAYLCGGSWGGLAPATRLDTLPQAIYSSTACASYPYRNALRHAHGDSYFPYRKIEKRDALPVVSLLRACSAALLTGIVVGHSQFRRKGLKEASSWPKLTLVE